MSRLFARSLPCFVLACACGSSVARAELAGSVPLQILFQSDEVAAGGRPVITSAGEIAVSASPDEVGGIYVMVDSSGLNDYAVINDEQDDWGASISTQGAWHYLNSSRNLLLAGYLEAWERFGIWTAGAESLNHVIQEEEPIDDSHQLNGCLPWPGAQRDFGEIRGVLATPSGFFFFNSDCGFIGGLDAGSLQVLVPNPNASGGAPQAVAPAVLNHPGGHALFTDDIGDSWTVTPGGNLLYYGVASCGDEGTTDCYDDIGFGVSGILKVSGGAVSFLLPLPTEVGAVTGLVGDEQLSGVGRMRTNFGGDVVFETSIAPGLGGALAASSGAGVSVVARIGDIMPGSDGLTFDTFSYYPDSTDLLAMGWNRMDFSISTAGDVYFVGGHGTGQSVIPHAGIFKFSGGVLTELILSGDPAPETEEGTTIQFITDLRINPSGRVAFTGVLDGDGLRSSEKYVIYAQRSDGTFALVGRSGHGHSGQYGAFDFGHGPFEFGGYDMEQALGAAFNDASQLVFTCSAGALLATVDEVLRVQQYKIEPSTLDASLPFAGPVETEFIINNDTDIDLGGYRAEVSFSRPVLPDFFYTSQIDAEDCTWNIRDGDRLLADSFICMVESDTTLVMAPHETRGVVLRFWPTRAGSLHLSYNGDAIGTMSEELVAEEIDVETDIGDTGSADLWIEQTEAVETAGSNCFRIHNLGPDATVPPLATATPTSGDLTFDDEQLVHDALMSGHRCAFQGDGAATCNAASHNEGEAYGGILQVSSFNFVCFRGTGEGDAVVRIEGFSSDPVTSNNQIEVQISFNILESGSGDDDDSSTDDGVPEGAMDLCQALSCSSLNGQGGHVALLVLMLCSVMRRLKFHCPVAS